MTTPTCGSDELAADIDCGDNSCRFAKNKTGMRTNGGCRCFENAGFYGSTVKAMEDMLRAYLLQKSELAHARAEAAEKLYSEARSMADADLILIREENARLEAAYHELLAISIDQEELEKQLRSQLAEAVKALGEWELSKETFDIIADKNDEDTYSGWHVGKYRRTAQALAKLREGKISKHEQPDEWRKILREDAENP